MRRAFHIIRSFGRAEIALAVLFALFLTLAVACPDLTKPIQEIGK